MIGEINYCKMRKWKIMFLSFGIITSCTTRSTNKENYGINYDSEKKRLTIYADSIDLSQINLISKGNFQQHIKLDSSLKIDVIKNVLDSPIEKDYVNTWIKLDKQGNVDYSKTYDYETSLVLLNGKPFLECYQPVSLTNGKKYVLLNNFNENFVNISNQNSDTILFNSKKTVLIPIKKPKLGSNNIRFIIVEEKDVKNNILDMRTTYVDKDFFLKDK